MNMAKSKNDNQPARIGKLDGSSIAATEAGQKRKRTVELVVCPTAFPDFSTVGGSTSRRREQQRNNLSSSGNSGKRHYGAHDRRDYTNKDNMPPALDIQETIREVHKFGAEGFTGVQKKSHLNAELERLTGRTVKRQKIPTKILVGMRKKALKREEREKQELKESGVVSHHSTMSTQGSKKKKKDRRLSKDDHGGKLHGVFGSNHARNTGDRRRMDPRSFGPAPDVGYMRKGMLKVKQP